MTSADDEQSDRREWATGTRPRTDPDWFRCPACGDLLYTKRWPRNAGVCPECGAHGRLDARTRLALLVDAGSLHEQEPVSDAGDPLGFVDRRPHPERSREALARTGEREAVACGVAAIGGQPLALAVMDFDFLGGSLGTGVGERLVQLAEQALAQRLPLVVVTASGGARMPEGALSLLQMAKVSQAVAQLHEAGLLFVTVVTEPTFGGVAASFATQADVILAEPGVRPGFAGTRVVRDTLRSSPPDGFQTAEFLRSHGVIDLIVERSALPESLSRLLRATTPVRAVPPAPKAVPLVVEAAGLPPREAWETVGLTRHAQRPTGREYIALLTDALVELHGDRQSADSPSIVGDIAQLSGLPVMMVATQKGHYTRELVETNFGMAGPEGYRKALRLFRLAQKLRLLVITLVDTPGAFPGIEAEQPGQSAAIAANILAMTGIDVPMVAVITGEGGSGGALALAVIDRVLMFESSIFSVISPEGCAAILWEAAAAPRLTAADLLRNELAALAQVPASELVVRRRARLRVIGRPTSTSATGTAAPPSAGTRSSFRRPRPRTYPTRPVPPCVPRRCAAPCTWGSPVPERGSSWSTARAASTSWR